MDADSPVGAAADFGEDRAPQSAITPGSTPGTVFPDPWVFEALYGRLSRAFGALGVVGSFVLPPDGLGFSICLLNRTTGLPCPGCGLTRSFACIAHLRFADALDYHPFGPVFYVWAWTTVVASFAGEARRARAASWFARHDRAVRFVYLGLVVAFLAFGFVRLFSRIWWRNSIELE